MKKKCIAFALALSGALICSAGLVGCASKDSSSVSSVHDSSPLIHDDSSLMIAVEEITLSESAITLDVGDEKVLTANVMPYDATDKTVVWSSDNTAVATVEGGRVKAVAKGTARITAASGGKAVSCVVKVDDGWTGFY